MSGARWCGYHTSVFGPLELGQEIKKKKKKTPRVYRRLAMKPRPPFFFLSSSSFEGFGRYVSLLLSVSHFAVVRGSSAR